MKYDIYYCNAYYCINIYEGLPLDSKCVEMMHLQTTVSVYSSYLTLKDRDPSFNSSTQLTTLGALLSVSDTLRLLTYVVHVPVSHVLSSHFCVTVYYNIQYHMNDVVHTEYSCVITWTQYYQADPADPVLSSWSRFVFNLVAIMNKFSVKEQLVFSETSLGGSFSKNFLISGWKMETKVACH